MRPFLLLLLTACAGPAPYRIAEADAAPRPRAAEVLASNDPLTAETGVEAVDEEHHHDPVCGMTVDPKTANGGSVTQDGKTYFFCSLGCRKAFESKHGGS
ncbi:MAG: YHS domain-containing protein [Archangium sp.]